MRVLVLLWLALATAGCARASEPADVRRGARLPVEELKLPPGFAIEVWARDVPNARQLALGAKGTVFAGTREEGKVFAIADRDGDGRPDTRYTIAGGLELPSGIAFRNGSLYVAEVGRILRFDAIEDHLADPPKPVVLNARLPGRRSHGWKFIGFGPDGWLYVPVGAPCNECEVKDPFGTILRMKPDGSGQEIFGRGIRNSVGFDWDPRTGDLWFTDNGRDELGEDVPPDELNHAPRAGLHFGYPYCHGGDIPDPEFGAGHPCSAYVPPAVKLGAHHAALGMRFYRGAMFPAAWKGAIVVAEHGSWNRKVPAGYRLVSVAPGATTAEPFVEGWLVGSHAWGRPADVMELPDGSLLVADDKAGAIYRITYSTR